MTVTEKYAGCIYLLLKSFNFEIRISVIQESLFVLTKKLIVIAISGKTHHLCNFSETESAEVKDAKPILRLAKVRELSTVPARTSANNTDARIQDRLICDTKT
jgi:hypothetical protein